MSSILTFQATGTVGAAGFRVGGVVLSAVSASASATITDGGTLRIQVTAQAGQTAEVFPADTANGFVFSGQPILATISGAGATVMVEEM